jgi:hypothetical protein
MGPMGGMGMGMPGMGMGMGMPGMGMGMPVGRPWLYVWILLIRREWASCLVCVLDLVVRWVP